jgi:hypothetical protein
MSKTSVHHLKQWLLKDTPLRASTKASSIHSLLSAPPSHQQQVRQISTFSDFTEPSSQIATQDLDQTSYDVQEDIQSMYYNIHVDVERGSKKADKRRQRNAVSSRRFRQRKTDKEKEKIKQQNELLMRENEAMKSLINELQWELHCRKTWAVSS